MAVSLSALSLIAIAGAVIFAQYARQPAAPLPEFEEVRPSLYRLTYPWTMVPGVPAMPVAVWLIESITLLSPRSWVLVDAGAPEAANTKAILDGLKAKLSTLGG